MKKISDKRLTDCIKKKKFSTRKQGMSFSSQHREDLGQKLFVYKCIVCHYYHLTSKQPY